MKLATCAVPPERPNPEGAGYCPFRFACSLTGVNMTDTQYKVLLALYNECNDDFWHLPQTTLDKFFNRLYAK